MIEVGVSEFPAEREGRNRAEYHKENEDQKLICYAVSGLGATGDIFQKLTLTPSIELRPVDWLPHNAEETIAEYARRLLPYIDTSAPFIIAGFSFGAVVAVELAKLTRPLLTVIVSGVTCRSEIPFYLKYARAFHVYRLAPYIVKFPAPLLRFGIAIAFSTRDPAALDLLVHMVQSTDPPFYHWGLEAMMDWDNAAPPDNLLHIHGSRDRLLPLRYVDADVVIKGGGHFIVYTHGDEIGRIIGAELSHLDS